ncbi:MAG: amidase [Dehalococcoidia bacterium]
MDDLVFLSAAELARRIQKRDISAVEVLDAYLGQIARYNPAVNAIVTLDVERARQRARAADAALAHGELWGPLHGVPVTIKDSIQTAGLRTTAGHPPLADHVPAEDATVVARLRAAGAIILGKTNLPPMSSGMQTDNLLFGRTNNPWDLERTVGGSTGGGAAAVAAGMSPLTIGADFGGSIRNPAHYCGVFGLKPTEHRVPKTGHIPPLPGVLTPLRHMLVIGPLARSVGDLQLALSIVAGPDRREWEVPPVPLLPVRERPLATLRLAWTDRFDRAPVSEETRAALTHLADGLTGRGCRVERRMVPDYDEDIVLQTYRELGAAMRPAEPVSPAAAVVKAPEREMQPYSTALEQRDALIAAFETFFGEWDALLCPVAAVPAFPHCPADTPIDVDGTPVPYRVAGTSFAIPFNVTGHPAVVLPLTRSRDGLPIGVQVVGRRWGEMKLLAIAAQLAEVIGPFQRPPGY